MKYTYILVVALLLIACNENRKNNKKEHQITQYAIGTAKFEILDKSRNDLIDSTKSRLIIGQIWYPSTSINGHVAAYINPKLISYMKKINYYQLDHQSLDSLKHIKSNSYLNAPIANNDIKFPIVFFIHGLGSPKEFHSLLIEEIVKNGYAVVAIDHPYGGLTISDKGRLMSSEMIGKFDLENQITDWSLDIKFTLYKLKNKDIIINKRILNQLDFKTIIVGGHSLGGNIALGIDKYITNIAGAFNLDGGSWEMIEKNGLKIPSLIMRSNPIYSDRELEKKGRNREMWDEMGKMIDSIHLNIYRKATVPITQIKVKGAGHMSFTDSPFYLPDLVNRFGGKIIDKKINQQLTKDFIVSFLDNIAKRKKQVTTNCYKEHVEIEHFN
jgi:pimeloyl-ACP methyl ester carboxylesterase